MFTSTHNLYAFVSTGSERKMYTLRIMQKGYIIVKGFRQIAFETAYVKNLSTDLQSAISKAKEFASNNGLEFKLTASSDVELFDITRLTPDQLDHRNWEKEQKRLKKEAEKEAKAKELNDKFQAIAYNLESIVSFGKYRDRQMTISEMVKQDPEYIHWLFENNDLPFVMLANHFQAQLNWIFKNVTLPAKAVNTSVHVGKEKDKLELTATVNSKGYKTLTVGYNSTVCQDVYRVTDTNGNVFEIVYGGTTWEMEEGKTYSFTAKVKSHFVSKGVNVTGLTYTSKVKEIE